VIHMVNKIALMGYRDSIIGFKLLGVDLFSVIKPEEACEKLDKIVKDKYAIVFITEEIACQIMYKIEELQMISSISFTVIPGKLGNRNIGLTLLKKNIEKAIGKDILFGKEGK